MDSPHRQFPVSYLIRNISRRCWLPQNVRPSSRKNCWSNCQVKVFSRWWVGLSLIGRCSTCQTRFATSICVRRTSQCKNLLLMESLKLGHVSGKRKPCLIFLTIGTWSNFIQYSSSPKVVRLHKYLSILSCVVFGSKCRTRFEAKCIFLLCDDSAVWVQWTPIHPQKLPRLPSADVCNKNDRENIIRIFQRISLRRCRQYPT